MLNVWTLKSGSSLGIFQERISLSVNLPTVPLTGNLSGVTFSVISGKLPGGTRIFGNKIIGTPFEVAVETEYKFVVRASLGNEISDRTFTMRVQGPDEPVWITPEGILNINPSGQAFVLDSTFVEFNLRAIDQDIKAGEKLDFFIQEGDGELPPGLTLSNDGVISGKIDPILSLDISAGSGFFDTNLYDSNPFDFGIGPRTGLDTFLYDTVVYDYINLVRSPRKLNRRYEFFASITDGNSIVKRKFSIYVVGDDFLRADNDILQIGDGTFTADTTYLRGAFWLSGSNLGIKRANNFVTIVLDTFDPNPALSPLVYELADTNPGTYRLKSTGEIAKGRVEISNSDLIFPNSLGTANPIEDPKNNTNLFEVIEEETPSLLPEGLFLDNINGEIFGYVPYQPAITKDYKFTIDAIKYDATGFTEVEVAVVVGVTANYGQNYLLINPLPQADVDLLINDYLRIGNFQYRIVSYTSQSVVGGQYALLRFDSPLKIDVPARDSQGNSTILTKRYIQSTLEFNTNVSSKTFDLKVLGEVDSVIKFITPSNLGSLRANFTSTLSVIAETTVPNAVLSYQLLQTNSDGSASKLPAGLTLNSSGELIGKVNQFSGNGEPGLTLFDNGATTFDGGTQTYDRSFRFSVLAVDQYQYSAVVGEFTLQIQESTDRLYSNLFVRPYQSLEKRNYFSNFITDSTIFTPDKIYRLNDPNFGVQDELKMLVYAGIETRSISDYVPMLNRNIKRKRFKMGDVKHAIAKQQGTNDILYEIIYIEVLDDYEIGKKSTNLKIKLPRNTNSRQLVNQARASAASGNLSTPENQAKLNRDETDRFKPIKDPFTADNTAVFASGRDQEYVYPSSIVNIRKNIRNLSVYNQQGNPVRAITIENEFLPLWMKTPQDRSSPATGFINAVPLCYCKPGQGKEILENIKNSGFDFGQIDYEIDRFLIDSTLGNSSTQFLKFTNYRYNV